MFFAPHPSAGGEPFSRVSAFGRHFRVDHHSRELQPLLRGFEALGRGICGGNLRFQHFGARGLHDSSMVVQLGAKEFTVAHLPAGVECLEGF